MTCVSPLLFRNLEVFLDSSTSSNIKQTEEPGTTLKIFVKGGANIMQVIVFFSIFSQSIYDKMLKLMEKFRMNQEQLSKL